MNRRNFLVGLSILALAEDDLLAAKLHEHPTILAMAREANAYRARMGRPPVAIHPQLTYAAVHHCRDMARVHRMSHTLFGRSPGARARAAGWTGGCGENIAMGQRSVSSVTRTWIGSSGHRRNLLSNWRYGGFGLAYSSSGAPYWCQLFG